MLGTQTHNIQHHIYAGKLKEEARKYLPLAMASGSLSLDGPGSLTETMAAGWTVSGIGFAGKRKERKLKES